jgi:TolB-like protein
MTESPTPEPLRAFVQDSGAAPPAAPQVPAAHPSRNIWTRLKEHKVMQWMLAYAAAAYTLLHGVEMLSDAQEWPHVIVRVFSLVLILGVPVVMTIAWYHGAKGLKRISGPELAILTVLLFIAGSILWGFSRLKGERTEDRVVTTAAVPASAAKTATPTAPRTSVAVMPFANLTGDATKDYLGDGMAEEVINTLAKVPGLKVPARTSSFAYKGRNTDIRQIAKDLGVGTILEGSVRAAGKRIRITAQLINALDGLHIWSETYDEQFTDLFKLQDDLAKAIGRALQLSLNGPSPTPISQAPPTQDVEAYNLYLQGSALLDRATEHDLNRAIEYFQQALGRDAKFVRAYSGIAEAHMLAFSLGKSVEHLTAAEKAAQQALALDPGDSGYHLALAGLNEIRGHWLEMEAHDQAALAISGNDTWVRGVRARHLAAAGRLHDALQEGKRGYALAPASALAALFVAAPYSWLGQDAEAVKYVDLATALGAAKDRGDFGVIYSAASLRAGKYADAADALIKSFDLADANWSRAAQVIKLVYAALADPSQKDKALAARARLYPSQNRSAQDRTLSAGMACTVSSGSYALLGALDVAYDLGNQCLDWGATYTDLNPASSLWTPEMHAFRRDPRFQAYVSRLGDLMAYWKQYGPPDDCDLKDGKLVCR